ncbi:MAG TPA: D-aminoacyl-tRNA deacylase [Armatimonadota bacterium]|nr:D-aminoacyl-tRNA deacylase [Armatimonadota bacterium]
MRAVVQRVTEARVRVEGQVVGEIGPGLMVLLGVKEGDPPGAGQYLAEKIANLRIFDDAEGRMERSARDVEAGVLVVSQFTLYGDARKGGRPSYIQAARGEEANQAYESVCAQLRALGLKVATGRFGAEMLIEMTADGPVTILLDSERVF